MKKLVYGLLVTTSLMTVSGASVYAVDTAYQQDAVLTNNQTSFGKTISVGSEDVSASHDKKVSLVQQALISPVNFTAEEADKAVRFADLAYKAYDASVGSNPAEVAAYKAMLTDLKTEGYEVTEIQGETGHTRFTDRFVYKSVIGLVIKKDDQATISFRGTKGLSDIITDLSVYTSMFSLKKDRFLGKEKGGVHAGFKRTFDSYESQLETIFEELKNDKVKNLSVVGHSLGGAQAQLAAYALAEAAKNQDVDMQIKVATYNAPRVGSNNFAKGLNEVVGGAENIARFTTVYRELVSSMLFGVFGWKHAGINVVVDSQPISSFFSNLWDKTKNLAHNHKLEGFKDGKAGAAVAQQLAEPVKHLGLREQLNNIKNEVVSAVKSAGDTAKKTFVSGFQKLRSGVAGWFGR